MADWVSKHYDDIYNQAKISIAEAQKAQKKLDNLETQKTHQASQGLNTEEIDKNIESAKKYADEKQKIANQKVAKTIAIQQKIIGQGKDENHKDLATDTRHQEQERLKKYQQVALEVATRKSDQKKEQNQEIEAQNMQNMAAIHDFKNQGR